MKGMVDHYASRLTAHLVPSFTSLIYMKGMVDHYASRLTAHLVPSFTSLICRFDMPRFVKAMQDNYSLSRLSKQRKLRLAKLQVCAGRYRFSMPVQVNGATHVTSNSCLHANPADPPDVDSTQPKIRTMVSQCPEPDVNIVNGLNGDTQVVRPNIINSFLNPNIISSCLNPDITLLERLNATSQVTMTIISNTCLNPDVTVLHKSNGPTQTTGKSCLNNRDAEVRMLGLER